MPNYLSIVVIVILVALTIVGILFFTKNLNISGEEKIITQESVFNFSAPAGFENSTQLPIKLVSKFWDGNGVYFPTTSDKKSKISNSVVLHPINKTANVASLDDIEVRFIVQKVLLPKSGKIFIKATVANAADYLNSSTGCTCADSIARIKLVDENGNETFVFDKILNSTQGWQDISLDISSYAGKLYLLRIEGVAGGTCSLWCGEFTAVNRVYITSK